MTFVRYIDVTGKICVRFLDIRPLDSAGVTADNIVKTFKQVASDYNLNLHNHIALSCDGARSMLGRHNGVAKQLEEEIGSMVSIHCHAHTASRWRPPTASMYFRRFAAPKDF